MKNILFSLVLFSILALSSSELNAQDFVYEPKNPAFGGSYLNYSWLLSSAQAQNTLEDPTQSRGFGRDPLTDFEESLNRQILNQLSRKIVENQFGEEGLEDGQYTLGNFQINIGSDESGVNIIINDTGTGNSTTVVVPYF